MFWSGMVVHFSSKDLRLSAGIFRTVSGEFELGLWTVFERSGAELLCLFWVVSGRIVGLLISLCVMFLVLLLKMNNMMDVCELC